MKAIIRVKNLEKSYGSLKAVNRISFSVVEGEIFGLVGPNGAGKTTTIECIEGLLKPDSGEVLTLGLNVTVEGYQVRKHIGILPQEARFYPRIRVKEAIWLFAGFYENSLDPQTVLKTFGLEHKARSFYGRLSGGEKRLVQLALAFVANAKILFLDEPTTGLDVETRFMMWDRIRRSRDEGKTIFLTTHYLEEAEQLCNRVAVLDKGEVVTLGSPKNLIEELNVQTVVSFRPKITVDAREFKEIPSVRRAEQIDGRILIHSSDREALSKISAYLKERGILYSDLEAHQPTLNDVYLSLTGRRYRKEGS